MLVKDSETMFSSHSKVRDGTEASRATAVERGAQAWHCLRFNWVSLRNMGFYAVVGYVICICRAGRTLVALRLGRAQVGEDKGQAVSRRGFIMAVFVYSDLRRGACAFGPNGSAKKMASAAGTD